MLSKCILLEIKKQNKTKTERLDVVGRMYDTMSVLHMKEDERDAVEKGFR